MINAPSPTPAADAETREQAFLTSVCEAIAGVTYEDSVREAEKQRIRDYSNVRRMMLEDHKRRMVVEASAPSAGCPHPADCDRDQVCVYARGGLPCPALRSGEKAS